MTLTPAAACWAAIVTHFKAGSSDMQTGGQASLAAWAGTPRRQPPPSAALAASPPLHVHAVCNYTNLHLLST
jgi:hypothetical protein